jgi:hypothetical protein
MTTTKRGRCVKTDCQCVEYAFWNSPPDALPRLACECCEHHAHFHAKLEDSTIAAPPPIRNDTVGPSTGRDSLALTHRIGILKLSSIRIDNRD